MARQATENFKREVVDGNIEVKVGDARTIVSDMNDGFDMIFQDVGNKHLYARCLRIMIDYWGQEVSCSRKIHSLLLIPKLNLAIGLKCANHWMYSTGKFQILLNMKAPCYQ